jgi:hypothetical protein
MPLDPEFVADCPYAPQGFLIDEILEIDALNDFVKARVPTSEDLPITREQRVHPERHPRHVSGGLLVHLTGMLGFVHAYYVLGLKHKEGWIGYGGHIHHARFHALASIGPPLILTATMTQSRRRERTLVAKYSFRFLQSETLVYSGEQSAMWMKVD